MDTIRRLYAQWRLRRAYVTIRRVVLDLGGEVTEDSDGNLSFTFHNPKHRAMLEREMRARGLLK
jgi:hypothetical protein